MPDSFWIKALSAGVGLVSDGHALTYIAPVLIWMLVSFRREDLGEVLPKRASHSTSSPKHGSVAARR